MSEKKAEIKEYKTGVIGSGTFGTAIANLLAETKPVLLYVRNRDKLEKMLASGLNGIHKLHKDVILTNSLESLCKDCKLIYPMVSSPNFRNMCQTMAPFIQPDHIIIHGTKGMSVEFPDGFDDLETPILSKEQINTMTEVIKQETLALRVGCLSGPNLAGELSQHKPAATVIASKFDEVIRMGMDSIRNPRFRVYGSHDVLGVELSGVLKNIMAIASGICEGLDLGHNAQAMLITRGLGEMIQLGKVLGSETNAFFGMAGIGDLIATCSSVKSRNFTLGLNLSKGKNVEQIIEEIQEIAEGYYTTKTAYALCNNYNLESPIIKGMYHILYKDAKVDQTLEYLMNHENDKDVSFI